VNAPCKTPGALKRRFGEYELHDLVVLDEYTVGVVVEIAEDACKVRSGHAANQATDPRLIDTGFSYELDVEELQSLFVLMNQPVQA
jgi:hypothetical protein